MDNKLNKFKVLVVDDVGSARKTLAAILRQMGIVNVTEAKSSLEALRRMECESFHLVISDWEMPDIDGLELFNTVRNIPAYKDTPFIMLTSSSEKDKVIEAISAGVTDYAIKPVSLETLSSKVLRVTSPIPAS